MKGFSKIFDKIITKRKTITVTDLTSSQKIRLKSLMCSYGASESFSYDRFFKEGFKTWEIEGIDEIKKGFIMIHKEDILEGAKDYVNVCDALKKNDVQPALIMFWDVVCSVVGLRSRLYEYMKNNGMKSNTTTLYRFRNDDWKKFERVGIRHILEEYIDAESNIEETSSCE